MLEVDGLHWDLDDLTLELNLRVERGCLALAGPTGAGKTSVLRAIAGLRNPDRGRISCAGSVWFDSDGGSPVPSERRRCGLVFQDYALFPHLRAWQNVAFALRAPREERRRRAM